MKEHAAPATSEPVSDSSPFLHSMPRPGCLFDLRGDQHPTLVYSWSDSKLTLNRRGTHFGLVGGGTVRLTCASGQFELSAGMYFVAPGPAEIDGQGVGFVTTLLGYSGLFQIGGPVESRGRLRYIDGCSDSLLVSPAVLGDPCLNLLYVPPGTDQTSHTHPSLRVGMIVDGAGLCRTDAGTVELQPGLVFAIRTDGVHSFHTDSQHLRIVAWHPDSDFGPTHERHPMLNRTLVDGRPVNLPGVPR